MKIHRSMVSITVQRKDPRKAIILQRVGPIAKVPMALTGMQSFFATMAEPDTGRVAQQGYLGRPTQ